MLKLWSRALVHAPPLHLEAEATRCCCRRDGPELVLFYLYKEPQNPGVVCWGHCPFRRRPPEKEGMSMCVRVSLILSTIYDIIRRCLHALVRAVVTPEEEKGQWAMDELLTPRQQTARQIKARFLEALQTNSVTEVLEILYTTNLDIDTVLEVEDKRMVLASYKQGFWLPDYKLECSWAMALHVCVMYNYLETALVLLQKGAAVNRKPNGKTPLHVACTVAHGDCVALLLGHGARVNSLSLSGHTPLHYCITKESVDCAKQLILNGGNVNKPSQSKDEDTPLHTAARLGIPELVALYISHGAQVDAVNSLQETPLITAAFWALDVREQTYSEDHHLVCRILLDHGADPNLYEDDYKTALHKASWNCDHVLMQMLLEAGADTTTMDINGCEPIQYVLKVTSVRPMAIPELCYQLLLNFGAPRVYPPQFHKVLQACHECPNAVEVMMNSYEYIKPTNKWRSSIPEASYKQHEEFYESMFAVCSNTPRCLMHLARCAVRRAMENRCHTGVGTLPLPPPIQRYLLLEPEGTFY